MKKRSVSGTNSSSSSSSSSISGSNSSSVGIGPTGNSAKQRKRDEAVLISIGTSNSSFSTTNCIADNPAVINSEAELSSCAGNVVYGVSWLEPGECQYILNVHDMRSSNLLTTLKLKWKIESYDFHSVSGLLVMMFFSSGKSSMKAWNVLQNTQVFSVPRCSCDSRCSISINHFGTKFVTGAEYEKMTLIVWDAASGTKLLSIPDSEGHICPKFSFDDSLVISALHQFQSDPSIHVWGAESGSAGTSIKAHGRDFRTEIICSSQSTVCACETSRDVTVIDYEQGMEMFHQYTEEPIYASCIYRNPSGGENLLISMRYNLKAFDVVTGQAVFHVSIFPNVYSSVAMDLAKYTVVAVGKDNTTFYHDGDYIMNEFDLNTGHEVRSDKFEQICGLRVYCSDDNAVILM
jgi:outer membrane protein assembly factor BamB